MSDDNSSGVSKTNQAKRHAFNFQDLTGLRFGHLQVLEFAGSIKRQTMWKCLCDCGNTKAIKATHLKSGAVKSCGCEFKVALARTRVHWND